MKQSLLTQACVLCFLSSVTANAETTITKDACAAAQTERDMSACHERNYQKADEELNAAYKQVIANKKKNGESELVGAIISAQRSWLAYRDAQCKLETWDSRDGSAFGIYMNDCLQKLTQQRTAFYHDWAEKP